MKKILWMFLIYFIMGSLLIFFVPKDVSKEKQEEFSRKDFYGTESDDRAIIFDNPLDSGLARLFMIENAKESLDVAYFSIETGETVNVFFGALFDAADRGVQVNILLDGMFHGLRFNRRALIYAMDNHPNIHLKFYEKFNPLLPWTVNNRMHDKYIIADKKFALIGGRNIGDKYFAPHWYEDVVTNDRDVLILNLKESDSVIDEMYDYFNEIFNHKYSKDVLTLTRSIFRRSADKWEADVKNKAQKAREMYQEQFDLVVDLEEISKPTHKVSFIHNPITRFNKEPWVFSQLIQLFEKTDETFIQSPYTIPNYKMMHHINKDLLKEKKITLLTNSLISTPNLPAFSGYLNYRNKMVDVGVDIFELQTIDSHHSKAFVYDDEVVAIGSFNFDPRSAFLSTESMVVIHSQEVVEGFGMNVERYADESLRVQEDYTYNKKSDLEASLFKKVLFKITSYLVKFVENLL